VPSVAFTIPPLAAVGLAEAPAREKDLKVRMKRERAEGWFTARQTAEKIYGVKGLVNEETGLVLGAHLVGPHAEEVINLFALAIRLGLTAEQLETTMFADHASLPGILSRSANVIARCVGGWSGHTALRADKGPSASG
jgi:glutathione reductase (NADPH)